MKDIVNIIDVQKIDKLENEYDLNKASLLERKLRLMINDNPKLAPIREKLRGLISDYEERIWSDDKNVTDALVDENDKAEFIVEIENRFVEKRKELIIKKLKEFDMNQQDLGILLGHPKSYMSELLNGVSQFSMKDLVVIHRIFGIKLEDLVPTYLQSSTRLRIHDSIMRLNKPKLKLRKADFAL
jgi:plasmid maintenance system antidote protein VapI